MVQLAAPGLAKCRPVKVAAAPGTSALRYRLSVLLMPPAAFVMLYWMPSWKLLRQAVYAVRTSGLINLVRVWTLPSELLAVDEEPQAFDW